MAKLNMEDAPIFQTCEDRVRLDGQYMPHILRCQWYPPFKVVFCSTAPAINFRSPSILPYRRHESN